VPNRINAGSSLLKLTSKLRPGNAINLLKKIYIFRVQSTGTLGVTKR